MSFVERWRRQSAGVPPASADRRAAGEAADWRTTVLVRTRVAGVIGLLWALAIVVRLGYLQVLQHDELVGIRGGKVEVVWSILGRGKLK